MDQQLSPSEPVFKSDAFRQAVGASLALKADNVIIVSELRVNATVVYLPVIVLNTARRLLQVLPFYDGNFAQARNYYTLAEVYIWMPTNTNYDILQTLMELMNNNNMSRDVSAALGTAVNVTFSIDPMYVQLSIMLALLRAKGIRIPEQLLLSNFTNNTVPTDQIPSPVPPNICNAAHLYWEPTAVANILQLAAILVVELITFMIRHRCLQGTAQ